MRTREIARTTKGKAVTIAVLALLCILSAILCIGIGSVRFSIGQTVRAVFIADDSTPRLLIWNLRLPRILTGALVGLCLSLSGCILQGLMRNHLASPSTIGVTSGASFVGYLTLVAFPSLSALLPVGSISGAFATTMLIYLLAYQKGASTVRIILSGLAVSTLFGAFSDVIRTMFPETLSNATGFLVGSLNGVTWSSFHMVLPYAIIGTLVCVFLPSRMNILLLGEETATSLGLRTEVFKLILIVTSSLLSGAAIAVAGIVGFAGLIVPHIARLLVGSDYKYLFPTSALLGSMLIMVCDTIGRVILMPGEVSVSIILAFLGAPFFLYLLRTKEAN